jgi:hypothetical protein
MGDLKFCTLMLITNNKKRSKNNKSPKLCLGDLINNNNKKRSKNNKSPKLCLGDLIILRTVNTVYKGP